MLASKNSWRAGLGVGCFCRKQPEPKIKRNRGCFSPAPKFSPKCQEIGTTPCQKPKAGKKKRGQRDKTGQKTCSLECPVEVAYLGMFVSDAEGTRRVWARRMCLGIGLKESPLRKICKPSVCFWKPGTGPECTGETGEEGRRNRNVAFFRPKNAHHVCRLTEGQERGRNQWREKWETWPKVKQYPVGVTDWHGENGCSGGDGAARPGKGGP